MFFSPQFFRTNQSGFSLVEIVLASGLLGLIVMGFIGAFLYGQESTKLSVERARAVMLAEEGLEAIRNIRDDSFSLLVNGKHGIIKSGNQWILSGMQDQTDIFTRQITITTINDQTRHITSTITWQQSSQRQGTVSAEMYLTNWQRVISDLTDLIIDTSSAGLALGNTRINGITLENTGTTDLILDKITVSWDVFTLMDEVAIDGNIVWSDTGPGTPSGAQSSGVEIDIQNVTLTAGGGAINLDYLQFDGDMSGVLLDMTFTMTDGSSKSVSIDFSGPSCPFQASTLTIDTSSADVGGILFTDLENITVQNTDPTCAITIDTITTFWNKAGRQIEQIDIANNTAWADGGPGSPSGSQNSGTEIDIVDTVLSPASGIVDIDFFRFDGNMLSTSFTITFRMLDGSTKSANIDLTLPEWVFPRIEGIYNTPSSADGQDVFVLNDTAYLVTFQGNQDDLYVIDVSNEVTPTLSSSLDLGSSGATGIDISFPNAYIASRNNSEELQIVHTDGILSQIGDFNKSGNADTSAIDVSGDYAYLATNNVGGNPGYELYILDVSTPSSPTLSGGLNIGNTINDITVSGNYAYLAVANDQEEFQVVDISNPTSPSVVFALDLPNNSAGSAVFVDGNYAYVGKDAVNQSGEFYIINITNPLSPIVMNLNGLELGDDVNDIFVDNNKAFIVVNRDINGFQVIDVTSPVSPISLSITSLAGRPTSIFVRNNTAFITTTDNNQELLIFKPY